MANPENAKTIYFNPKIAWVINKFTPEEIALFFKEGIRYFGYLKETPKSTQYLDDHPEFAEVFEKW